MDSEVPGEQREPHHRRLWVAVHRFSLRIWHWVNHRTHNYILYLAQAGKNFATKGQHEAVGFAYWAIFSLFPFLVLLIIITTSVLGSRSSRTDIFSVLSQLLPQVGSTLIQDTLNKIIPQHPAFSFLSAVGLFWGARKLFTNLQASLSRIFRDEKRRPWYWEFPIGLTMMATFGGLIVLSTSLASLFRLISLRVSGPRSPLIGLEGIFALLIINMALLMMLFRFIPQRKISWKAIIFASVLGSVGWEVSRALFDWYLLHVANLGVVYGPLAAVMGLLMWMFFVGSLISLCAEIAVATADWQLARPPSVAIDHPEPNRPVDELSPALREEFAVHEPEEDKEPVT